MTTVIEKTIVDGPRTEVFQCGIAFCSFCMFSAGSAGMAPAQTLGFSATGIVTPANINGYTQGVAVGDFNADGKPDLALVSNGSPDRPQVVVVLLGNGDGTFQKGVLYPPAGRTPQTVVVADFNGDGKQDLAVPEASGGVGIPGGVSLFLGNGDGTFQPATRVEVHDQCAWLAVGDFNKDGKLDLAVPSPNTNRIAVLLSNGDGTYQAPVIYQVGRGPAWIVAADLNGDGSLDLATANYGTSDVSVLLGKGDGTFEAAASISVGQAPIPVSWVTSTETASWTWQSPAGTPAA